MAEWTRGELEQAFTSYQAAVAHSAESGDWEHFVQRFAPDASYVEHAYGRFSGHDAIRKWVTRTMGSFPGNTMTSFPPAWSVVDEDRGWVICEIRNLMRDPGDGSTFEASNLTILRYASDGLWAEEEDIYNPAHFVTMVTSWLRRCRELGTVPDDGRRWADHLGLDVV